MSYSPESYERDFLSPGETADTRAAFLQKVYAHVFGALLLMTGLIALFVTTFGNLVGPMMLQSWWMVLVAFMVVSFVAQKMAASQASRGIQYAGLGLYTLAEALILTPIVYIVTNHFNGGGTLVSQAAILTLLVFGGLSAVVYITGASFDFLRGFLSIAFFGVLGLIAISYIFPNSIQIGTWFSVGMVALLSLNILYQTSTIRDEWPSDGYVSAALWLFGSIATMFFYILQILMSFSDE